MTIYLITTGGTIEKGYSEQTGKVLNLDRKIAQYLERLRLPATGSFLNEAGNRGAILA